MHLLGFSISPQYSTGMWKTFVEYRRLVTLVDILESRLTLHKIVCLIWQNLYSTFWFLFFSVTFFFQNLYSTFWFHKITLAYFSRALNDSQKRYSVFHLELLAIFAAIKYFEHFFLDQQFTIVTDYLSLVHAFKRPSPSQSPRQSRQLSYLSEFNCDITHIPGALNGAANCLSRLVVHHIFEQDNLDITLQDIAKAQKACIAQQPDIFQFPRNSTILLQETELHTKVGPCKLFADTSQTSYRILIHPLHENVIIDHYHKLNHLGIRASQRFIIARFVFRDMNRKIKDRVKACTACQQSKVYRHVISPTASVKMPDDRFDTIHADLCGPFPDCQGFSYLLVCIDRFSRFVTAYPMRNAKSEFVVLGINSFVSMFGQMLILRVNYGVQWNSTLFREYVSYLGCDLCISNTRYPESNGLVDRAIKNITVALTAKRDRNHWLFYLSTIVLSLSTMYREELGGSPCLLSSFTSARWFLYNSCSLNIALFTRDHYTNETLCSFFKTYPYQSCAIDKSLPGTRVENLHPRLCESGSYYAQFAAFLQRTLLCNFSIWQNF